MSSSAVFFPPIYYAAYIVIYQHEMKKECSKFLLAETLAKKILNFIGSSSCYLLKTSIE